LTDHSWHTTYTDAVQRFGGDTPGAQLEQQVLDAFTDQPQVVIRAIDKVAAKYAAGRVTSPWGAMKHEIARTTSQPDIVATDSTDRDKRIMRAEQWIRAAGIHYDRDTEILLELFGNETSLLRPFAKIDLIPDTSTSDGKWTLSEAIGDTALVERILKTYHDARPTGIQLEEDALARAEKYKADQARLRQALEQAHAELAAAQPAHAPNNDLPL
jgi:hypothetical protein